VSIRSMLCDMMRLTVPTPKGPDLSSCGDVLTFDHPLKTFFFAYKHMDESRFSCII
jgi:hypothetical protein